MATANVQTVTKTIEKVVLETIGEKKVILSIDEEEAVFLIDILSKVAGGPESTRRRHSDAIADALGDAGIRSTYKQTGFFPADLVGHIGVEEKR